MRAKRVLFKKRYASNVIEIQISLHTVVKLEKKRS